MQQTYPNRGYTMNFSRIRYLVWAILTVPALFAGSLAQAAQVGIRDEAGFFSQSAQSAAARVISDIQANQKRDLVIETYREIPAAARRGVDLQDKAAVKRVFEMWSVQRARELGVQGIYVVLTREPAHLQVAVGNETQRQAFTPADRTALADTMLDRLRAKKYDEALISGVGFVRDTLAAHSASGVTKPSGSSRNPAATQPTPTRTSEAPATSSPGPSFLSGLLPLLLLGVVVLVVIRMIGRLFGGGLSGGMQPGMGGGGFMRSMLGGLFGAAAGMWLYNQFTGHGSAFGADNPPGPDGGNDAFGGGQDTDYSSSGGDFGDSSGGGDSGGGGDF